MRMPDIDSDPLREVRLAKRWALAGIVVAVAALIPIYAFALGLSAAATGLVVGPAALVALLGIELGSRWEYRMRRRYAYPYRLGYELAAIHEFRQACARSVELVGRWLSARQAVVAWLTEDGEALSPVAAYGLPQGWVERSQPIPLGGRSLQEVLGSGDLAGGALSGVPWFGDARARGRLVLVPLVSRDRPEGLLAVAAAPGNGLVRDQRLLSALGMVMGLALDNCRLYEGQRAHALHLQELNRMKSDFLSTVSHELRTPLTSIMIAAEMLMEEEDFQDPTSPRGRLIRSIVKGASRLSNLVNDLVNISREDDFQPRLELDTVRLADIVASAVGIIQPLAAAKRQTIDVKLTEPDCTVRADRLRLEQVLVNLLSNAQRYSPVGGRIVVSGRREGQEIVLRVQDSGPGVAEEDRELIFEPFYRGDRSGLGLGLAIAKSLVGLHNGRIWVESPPEGGSAFCVALPIGAGGPKPKRLASPVSR